MKIYPTILTVIDRSPQLVFHSTKRTKRKETKIVRWNGSETKRLWQKCRSGKKTEPVNLFVERKRKIKRREGMKRGRGNNVVKRSEREIKRRSWSRRSRPFRRIRTQRCRREYFLSPLLLLLHPFSSLFLPVLANLRLHKRFHKFPVETRRTPGTGEQPL